MESDIKALKELNACLQDVVVNQDDFGQVREEISKLAAENAELQSKIAAIERGQREERKDTDDKEELRSFIEDCIA